MKAKNRLTPPAIETGQIWRMDEITCQIGEVGKRLVHYKLFKGKVTRVPSTLGNKEALEKYLKTKKAVLMLL